MKRPLLLITLLLVSCASQISGTEEHSCAPQNIKYIEDINTLICYRVGAVSENVLPIFITCEKGTFKSSNGIQSCVGSGHILHVIKPILLSADEAFSKKQDCEKLITSIEKRLEDHDKEMNMGFMMTNSKMEKVFYSVSMNSCLYSWTEMGHFSNSKEYTETFIISDGLTGQRLLNTGYIEGSDNEKAIRDEFQSDLKRYE